MRGFQEQTGDSSQQCERTQLNNADRKPFLGAMGYSIGNDDSYCVADGSQQGNQ